MDGIRTGQINSILPSYSLESPRIRSAMTGRMRRLPESQQRTVRVETGNVGRVEVKS